MEKGEKIIVQEKDKQRKREGYKQMTNDEKLLYSAARNAYAKRRREEGKDITAQLPIKPTKGQTKQKYNAKVENQKRIKKIRDQQTEKERVEERKKARERMVKSREKQTIEKKTLEKLKAKEGMTLFRREGLLREYSVRSSSGDRMKKRKEKSVEEVEYINVAQRQRLRRIRSAYTEKEYEDEKLKAKKGMRLFRTMARLRKYSVRSGSKTAMQKKKSRDPLLEWKEYGDKSEAHRRKLEEMNPDIVSKISEHVISGKESEEKQIEDNQRKENVSKKEGKGMLKYNEREENQKRIKKIREEQTDKERVEARIKAREGMFKSRAKKTIEEKVQSLADARDRMTKIWNEKSVEEVDFINVIKRKRLRRIRSAYTKNEYLDEQLKAKEGMRLFHKEGTVRNYSDRSGSGTGIQKRKNRDPMFEWKEYREKSEGHRKKLEQMNPDIVTKINEHMRLQKEEMRKRSVCRNMGIRQFTRSETEMIEKSIAQRKKEKQCEVKQSEEKDSEKKQPEEEQSGEQKIKDKQHVENQSEEKISAEKQVAEKESEGK